ncbi:MAG: protein-disulfide reductase DsbD domain-containing protein [Pseudomonadota bacterium]
MTNRTFFAAVLAACLSAVPISSGAQGLFGQKIDFATVYAHAGVPWEGGQRMAAIRMELKPGWKTYWRSPGETGIPPHFDWSRSENLASVQVMWPTPKVFTTFGAQTIGYEHRVVLPLKLTAEDPSAPIRMRLGLSFGVCEEICVPAFQEVSLDIPAGAADDGAYFVKTAMDAAPMTPAEGGLAAHACGVEGAGEERRFSAALDFAQTPSSTPVIVAEGPEGVWFSTVSSWMEDGAVLAEGMVRTDPDRWIDRSALTVTVLGGERAIEINGCATG